MARIPWGALAMLITSVAFLSYRAVAENKTATYWVVMSPEQSPALTKLQDMSHFHGERLTVLPVSRSLEEFGKWLDTVTLQSNDIVIFTDATSIFQVKSQAMIRKRFLEFGKPIVFAGHETLDDRSLKSYYNPVLTAFQPFPYLNPNACIGRVWALRQLVKTALSQGKTDETAVLTKALKQHPELGTIDTQGTLFVTHVKKSAVSTLLLNPFTRTVTCRGTGTSPLIVQTKEHVVPFYAYFSV